jgi:hypothetical protein
MMFGKVVGTVCLSFAPVNLKLALADTIADPVEAHVDRFGSFLLDGVSGNATGSVVVGGHWCCRLWVPHFFKGNAKWTRFFAIVEESTEFGFGGT